MKLTRGEHFTIIGKTGCGKSAYVERLVAKYRDKYPDDRVVIVNHKSERSWNKLLPPVYERPSLKDKVVNWAVLPDDNDELDEYLMSVYVRARSGEPALVVIDEGLAMPQNSRAIKTLFTQGRSLGLTVVLLTQRPSGVNLAAITQSSYLVIFNLFGKADLDRLDGYMAIDLSQFVRPANKHVEGRGLAKYHYLIYDVNEGSATVMPPITLNRVNPFDGIQVDKRLGYKWLALPAIIFPLLFLR